MKIFEIEKSAMKEVKGAADCVCICIFTTSAGAGHGGPLPEPRQKDIDDAADEYPTNPPSDTLA